MTGDFRSLMMSPYSGIVFPFTVESMSAIVAGLAPQPGESILAVTGCGDQVFALLERGAKVTAVDINQSQLDYLRRRRNSLERNNSFTGFYGNPRNEQDLESFRKRQEYFDEERYENLRKQLSNLEIASACSLEEVTAHRSFDKIYASDAIGELYCPDLLQTHLLQIARGLLDSGLLYCSNGPEINNLVKDISISGLQKDEDLTLTARRLETIYLPNVYRKAALN